MQARVKQEASESEATNYIFILIILLAGVGSNTNVILVAEVGSNINFIVVAEVGSNTNILKAKNCCFSVLTNEKTDASLTANEPIKVPIHHKGMLHWRN